MLVSLLWYYRPDHAEDCPEDLRPEVSADVSGSGGHELKVSCGQRVQTAAPAEVFASKHRDTNSVACIEDKCFVLTWNEYCR